MNIGEINPVSPDVRSVLLLIPLNVHGRKCTYMA
jgi:hypothetical protein